MGRDDRIGGLRRGALRQRGSAEGKAEHGEETTLHGMSPRTIVILGGNYIGRIAPAL
jgi:hypothetical protein